MFLHHFVLLVSLLGCVWANAQSDQQKPEQQVYNDLISLIPDTLFNSKMKASLKDVIMFGDKIFSRVHKVHDHPLPVFFGCMHCRQK
jgi:hypothetical protein